MVRGMISRQLNQQVNRGVRSELERGVWQPQVCRQSLNPHLPTSPGSVGPEGRRPLCKGGAEKERACHGGHRGWRERFEETQESAAPRKPRNKGWEEAWQAREHCRGSEEGCGPRSVQWI